jgi:hypothetical protein
MFSSFQKTDFFDLSKADKKIPGGNSPPGFVRDAESRFERFRSANQPVFRKTTAQTDAAGCCGTVTP